MAEDARKSEKLNVKTLLIVLGLVCIVLGAGLIAVFAFYAPKMAELESEMSDKDLAISSLTAQIQALTTQIFSLQNSLNQSNQLYADMNAQITSLMSQVYQLESRLRLEEYGVLVNRQALTQEAGGNSTIWSSELGYAGYVVVEVESSSNSTYVEVDYLFETDSYLVNFSDKIVVQQSGSAVFPILPSYVVIKIGNTAALGPVNSTVTAIYYY